MSYCPCDDPKVKRMMAFENGLMALGGTMNPLTQLSHAHFAASTRQRHITISIDAWSLPPGWFTHQLLVYGIPVDLKDLQYDCDPQIGIYTRSSIVVPIRQAWMADRTLRALSKHQGFRVTSPPIYDKGRGSSRESGATGKIWKPWGVPAKTASFGMGLSRGIGALAGFSEKRSYEKMMALREMSEERRKEYEEQENDQNSEHRPGTSPGRPPRKRTGRRAGHRNITIKPKRKRRRRRTRRRSR